MSFNSMTTVREDVSVHPKTITEFSEKPKSSRKRGSNKSSKITKVTVDPRIWETALKLAEGDALRIKVIHETEVIVLNHRKTA